VRKLQELSLHNAQQYLIKNNFTKIGSGCESVVFSKKGFDYVIKLQYDAFTYSGTKKEIPCEKHFTKQLVFNHSTDTISIIIQEKVDQVVVNTRNWRSNKRFHKFVEFVERRFYVGDTHEGNIGIKNGKFLVFDWTTRPDF
jgi:hypothetical protein